MPLIAVCIASFNRKEITVACLQQLFAAVMPPDFFLEVYLFDDASSDGTADAVRESFPQVVVVEGDGQQYWVGGMRAAMIAAAARKPEFILWLNDDVQLFPDGITVLLEAHSKAAHGQRGGPHIVVGAVVDPVTSQLTYSGFRRSSRWHPGKVVRVAPQAGRLVPCDTMNGNCVLIPAGVLRSVGTIDKGYIQQLGDLDYGYRAVRAGASIWIAPNPVGTCAPNLRPKPWLDGSLKLRDRFRLLNSPHGIPIRPWLLFMWRFGGPVAVALLFRLYIRLLLGAPVSGWPRPVA